MVTQTMGFGLATPTQWRLVLLVSSAISAVQYLLAPAIVESPAYLNRNGLTEERKAAIRSLWGHQFGDARPDRKLDTRPPTMLTPYSAEDLGEEPLLASTNEVNVDRQQTLAVTIPELLASPELRKPLLIIVFAMLSQQMSGTNLPRLLLSILVLRIKPRHQCRQDIHPTGLPLMLIKYQFCIIATTFSQNHFRSSRHTCHSESQSSISS